MHINPFIFEFELLHHSNLPIIPNAKLPDFAKPRCDGWVYVGWISVDSLYDFIELCDKTVKSDHGELRELDMYPEGAVCWMKEI